MTDYAKKKNHTILKLLSKIQPTFKKFDFYTSKNSQDTSFTTTNLIHGLYFEKKWPEITWIWKFLHCDFKHFFARFPTFLAALWSPILRETLLTNMTNDVAGNDAAYCSIRKKVEQFLIFATKPCQEINFHQIYQNLSKSHHII